MYFIHTHLYTYIHIYPYIPKMHIYALSVYSQYQWFNPVVVNSAQVSWRNGNSLESDGKESALAPQLFSLSAACRS